MPKQLETSQQILEQTRRITRIVESLVTFSHSGGIKQAPIMSVNVRDAVDEAISLLLLDPDHRLQQFENHCASDGWATATLNAINLLGNAADACTAGQAIRIYCEETELSGSARGRSGARHP